MMELKITIEAQDLSQAIAQLAMAVGGAVRVTPNELIIPAGAKMQVTGVQPVPAPAEPAQSIPAAPLPTDPTPEIPAAPIPADHIQAPVMPEVNPPMPPVEPKPASAPIDLDAISRAGAALIDQGKMDQVIEVLQKKYGLLAVTQLQPPQFESFAADLRALGANI